MKTITIKVEDDLFEKIAAFQHLYKIPTLEEAAIELLEAGLKAGQHSEN